MQGFEFYNLTNVCNRRLSLAGKEIIETDAIITDIALKYSYETPESYAKTLTRLYRVVPKFAGEESAKLMLFNPIVIKITVEGGKSKDYGIVQTGGTEIYCARGKFYK